MKFHDTLNEKIWDLNTEDLIPEVKEKLEEIAEAFIEFLEIPTDAVLDKVITGSSASYNYNEFSDLDLHIIVDYDKVHEDCPLVNGYLNSLKKQFNDNHDIFIHGVPVELYAEQKDQGTVHNGLYSLQTGWIDKPQKIAPTDNDAAVEAKYNEIKELVDKCDDSEEATELLEKIYNMRKAGLAEAGEFCTENLAFKKLRNEGCMDKLRQIKKEQIDKQLSLESYNEEQNVKILTPEDKEYLTKLLSKDYNKIGVKQQIEDIEKMLKNYVWVKYEKGKNRISSAEECQNEFGRKRMLKYIAKANFGGGLTNGKSLDNYTIYSPDTNLEGVENYNESIKEGFNKGDKVQLKRKNNKIGIVKSIFNGDKDKNDKDIKYLDVEFEDGTKEGRPASDFKKVNESIKEDWSAEDIDKYNKERIIKVKQVLEKQFKRLGFTDVKWDEAKQIYFFKYLDEPYYIVINTPGINGTGYDLYKANDYGVAKGRLLTYRDVWLIPEDVIPFVRAVLSDIHKFIFVDESMEEDYNIGDKITINNKEGVIDSSFRLQDDNSLLGIWVKFDNDVKYYTVEELNNMKNESINEEVQKSFLSELSLPQGWKLLDENNLVKTFDDIELLIRFKRLDGKAFRLNRQGNIDPDNSWRVSISNYGDLPWYPKDKIAEIVNDLGYVDYPGFAGQVLADSSSNDRGIYDTKNSAIKHINQVLKTIEKAYKEFLEQTKIKEKQFNKNKKEVINIIKQLSFNKQDILEQILNLLNPKDVSKNESIEEDYEEDDCEDVPEEMHKERYVTYFETQEGRQKYTTYHVYTDSTDDSYNELCDKRDNQLGMYNSYKELKDALKERAEKIAKQQGWTVKSIENLGEDEEYYRERNKWESIEEIKVDEDLATLEKKVDKADQDIQDIIVSLQSAQNESIYSKLEKSFKKALGEEVREPGIDTHNFKFTVNDDGSCYLKSEEFETQIDDIDLDNLQNEIEDCLDFEHLSFYVGEDEDEITGTEIVGFKYNPETKEGEFEFNIFFEE